MSASSNDSLEGLGGTELVGLVRRLIGEVERLREENEKLNAALAAARLENQQLKDEIRRLKGLPPRPPMKPSGMEKATDRFAAEKPSQADASPPRRRGPGVSKLSIDRTVTLTTSAPAGSRHKGYEDIIVQDIAFKPEVTLYRRERWAMPDGRTVTAELPASVVGGCGPHLHRLVLTLHFQGQMTCERIVAVLTAAGLAISKRQVVRLMTAKLELFRAEEEAAFSAGLRASPWVSVDDTGARHAGKACYTTQFGSDRFTAFRTGPSKSRLMFLRNLLGGTARYAVNAAAVAYMRAANLAHGVIDALRAQKSSNSPVKPTGGRMCARSAWPSCGSPLIPCAWPAKARCGARSAPRIGSPAPSSSPMTRGSSASATTRCAGFTPSVSSTSSSPPTTGSAALSKSRGG